MLVEVGGFVRVDHSARSVELQVLTDNDASVIQVVALHCMDAADFLRGSRAGDPVVIGPVPAVLVPLNFNGVFVGLLPVPRPGIACCRPAEAHFCILFLNVLEHLPAVPVEAQVVVLDPPRRSRRLRQDALDVVGVILSALAAPLRKKLPLPQGVANTTIERIEQKEQ